MNAQTKKKCEIVYLIVKAILQVLSNPAVVALLKMIWLLLKPQSNNEVLRDLTIPVISP
jgi:hypothetical protein